MSTSSSNQFGHASSSRSPLSATEDDQSDDGLEIQRDELLAEEDPLFEDGALSGGYARKYTQQLIGTNAIQHLL